MTTHLHGRVAAPLAVLVALAVAACTGSAASPSAVPASPGASVAPATATAPPTAATAADTAGDSPAASPAATPVPTPAPRAASAWVRGQIVKADVLVGPGSGWVLTNRGLWQTTNDGTSWLNAYPRHLIASSIRGLGALDANHALLAAVDVGPSTSTYYVWHTADAGLTWAYTALSPIPHDIHPPGCAPGDFCGQPGDPPASFDFVDARNAFVSISMRQGIDGQHTYLFGTSDGGAHWSARAWTPTLLSGGPDPIERVQFQTPTVGTVSGGNEIASTTAGWSHWTDRTLPTENWPTPTIYFIGPADWRADEGLTYGTVQYTYATSVNHGASWIDHSVDVPGLVGLAGAQIHFLSATEWVGTCQTMTSGSTPGASTTIYTTDGGAHFAMYGHQPFNGSIATFIDSNHGWAGPSDPTPSEGSLTTRLYSTADRGIHWRLLTP